MAQQIPDFDSIKQLNPYGQEYWSARALMPLLGYDKWQRFEDAIHRAKTSCEQTDNVVDHHFTGAGKMIETGKGAQRQIKDYYLSRLACYLIAMNGDPRKPEIAAAQQYFAIATRTHEMHQLRKEQEERLEERLKVSDSYKQLARTARNSGVNDRNFGLFMDAGYLGLHRHTLERLKEKKGIPENEEYLDRIGREELSAIDFKNVQTDAKLRRDEVAEEDEAIQTHYYVGDQVRKTLETLHAPMPEDLPSAPSIRKMVEEQRKATKKHKLKAAEQNRGELDQETLF